MQIKVKTLAIKLKINNFMQCNKEISNVNACSHTRALKVDKSLCNVLETQSLFSGPYFPI